MTTYTIITFVFLVPYFVTVIVFAIGTTIISLFLWLVQYILGYCFQSGSARKHDRQTLVILGTGWGSYRLLLDLNYDLYDVVVVSQRNHFLFTPLLCSTTVGTLETRSVIEPVYSTHFGKNYRFILGEALNVDFKARKVHCRCLDTAIDIFVSYDILVIGVGAVTKTYGVPGVDEYSLFLKEALDAQKIRRKLLYNIQQVLQNDFDDETRKQLLHFVIVGGGPTGIEFSAELFDFLTQDAFAIFGNVILEAKVTIIEKSDILASFHPTLRKYTERLIRKRAVFEIVRSTVVKVVLNGVMLQDGSFVSAGLVVWTGGITQRRFTTALSLPKNTSGQILVDSHLSVTDHTLKHQVYALGDCAQIVNTKLPCTAQVAFQQGQYLAGLINNSSSANGTENELVSYPPFLFKSLGTLAYVGNYKAVANLEALPITLQLTGAPAFVIWRLAYLLRLVSWRQRLQVPVDWFKTAVFGRDVSQITN